jgi:hypothetical protein
MKYVTFYLAASLAVCIDASPLHAQGVGGVLPYTGNNGNAPLTFNQDQGITDIRDENPDLFRKVFRLWLRTYPIDAAPPIAKWTQADLHRFVRIYDKKILSQSNTSNEGLYATWFFRNVFDADGGSDGDGDE